MATYSSVLSSIQSYLTTGGMTPLHIGEVDTGIRHDSQTINLYQNGRLDFYSLSINLREEKRLCNQLKQTFDIIIKRYFEYKEGENKIVDVVADVEALLVYLEGDGTLDGALDYWNFSDQQIVISNEVIGNTRVHVGTLNLVGISYRN